MTPLQIRIIEIALLINSLKMAKVAPTLTGIDVETGKQTKPKRKSKTNKQKNKKEPTNKKVNFWGHFGREKKSVCNV